MKPIKITTLKHINKKRGIWDGYYILMNDDHGFRFSLSEPRPLEVRNCKGNASIFGLLLWILCDCCGIDYIRFCAYFRRLRGRYIRFRAYFRKLRGRCE